MAAEISWRRPPEWQDDSRMNFMFSAFPENRNVNPKHWDSKIQFWRNAIIDSCNSFEELFIDVELLKSRFQRNGVVPLGLNTVLLEMSKKGDIISAKEFLDSVDDTWSAWSYGVMKKTLWWGIGKVWQNDEEIKECFILLDRVKKKAQEVLSCHHEMVKHTITDNIVPEKVLKARLKASSVKVNDKELEIVICHLRKQKQVAIHILENNEKVFKFADRNEGKVDVINETDLNILRLKKAEACIQLQIKKLHKDIKELQYIVLESYKEGFKTKARRILCRKQMLLKTVEKKESLLLNTQDILRQIQDSHSDANVIQALKAGAQVFKTISQESGLTIDNVEKIMAEIEDVMDERAEIDRTISEGSKTFAAISDLPDDENEDLERELENLLLEENKDNTGHTSAEDNKDYFAAKLPDVPTSSPLERKERIAIAN